MNKEQGFSRSSSLSFSGRTEGPVSQAVVVDDGTYSALYLDAKLVSPIEFIDDLVKALEGRAVTIEFRSVVHDESRWPVWLSELMASQASGGVFDV